MSTPTIASFALLLVGVLIGLLPLVGGFRGLPRWIRLAQFLIGSLFVVGALMAFALYSGGGGHRFSDQLHRFIFFHVVLIVGMGLGMILLLVISGEYFK